MKSKVWNHRNLSIDKTQFNLQLPKSFSVERGEDSSSLEDTDPSMIIKEVFIGNDAELSSPLWLKKEVMELNVQKDYIQKVYAVNVLDNATNDKRNKASENTNYTKTVQSGAFFVKSK